MYPLYLSFVLMLLGALGLLLLPFVSNKHFFARYYLGTALFMMFGATGLYGALGNRAALQQWLNQGKQHYQLQEEVAKLGGIDQIIIKIKQKLARNPDDAEGWFILGRLYLTNHRDAEAKKAFANAALKRRLFPPHTHLSP